MLKIGTHFSGIGAPEQALKNLGIAHKIEFACEIDPKIQQIYLLNHSTRLMVHDISVANWGAAPYVDLLVAGFPCTDCSIAGSQNLAKGRTTLVSHTLDYVDSAKPKWVILENVKNLLNAKFANFYGGICSRLSANYIVAVMVLNSCDFGVAQNRERLFFVCIRKDLGAVPQVPNGVGGAPTTLATIMQTGVTTGIVPSGTKFYTDPYYITSTGYRQYDKSMAQPSPKGRRSSYERVYTPQCISPTLTTQSKLPWVLDGTQIRSLTTVERLRLQGFPDNFAFGGHASMAAHCIGNSMTVPVLEAIIKSNNIK